MKTRADPEPQVPDPDPVCPGRQATPAAELPSRDHDLALRIAGGSPEIAGQFLDALLRELPEAVEGLRRVHAERDWDKLDHRTHKLHGAAAVCGVPALEERLARLEAAAKTRETTDFDGLLQAVERESQRLLEAAVHDQGRES